MNYDRIVNVRYWVFTFYSLFYLFCPFPPQNTVLSCSGWKAVTSKSLSHRSFFVLSRDKECVASWCQFLAPAATHAHTRKGFSRAWKQRLIWLGGGSRLKINLAWYRLTESLKVCAALHLLLLLFNFLCRPTSLGILHHVPSYSRLFLFFLSFHCSPYFFILLLNHIFFPFSLSALYFPSFLLVRFLSLLTFLFILSSLLFIHIFFVISSLILVLL